MCGPKLVPRDARLCCRRQGGSGRGGGGRKAEATSQLEGQSEAESITFKSWPNINQSTRSFEVVPNRVIDEAVDNKMRLERVRSFARQRCQVQYEDETMSRTESRLYSTSAQPRENAGGPAAGSSCCGERRRGGSKFELLPSSSRSNGEPAAGPRADPSVQKKMR